MNKKLLGASIMLNIVCLIFFGYLSYKSKADFSDYQRIGKEDSQEKSYKIAVFTPATHPSLEKIQQGFCDGLTKKYGLKCVFDVYNANGSRMLMHSQAEEIVQGNYDLIYSIGAMPTQMVKSISLKKQSKENLTPIVFGVVARPQKLGLIENEQSSGNHLTGLTADPDYQLQIDMLHVLKPDMKNVLVVYDPTQSSGLEYDKKIVERIFKEKSIQFRAVEIYKANEVYSKVSSLLKGVDVLFVFKDNTIVSGIDSLIKLCSRSGVTLCTSELDSVKKGAALGFSVTSYDSGLQSSEKAFEVLVNNKLPSQIPVTPADKYKMVMNENVLEKQGLHINSAHRFLIRSGEVVS